MCGMKSSAIWLAAAAFAPWAAGAVEVRGASLAVTLDEQAKGAVTRLVTAHGAELAPTGVSTPIFRLKLTRADDFTKSVVVTADDAETCALEEGAQNAARFVYGGFKEGVLFVSCTAQGGGTHVRWRISVQTAPGWAVEETEYPRLLVSPALGSDGGDDRFAFGAAKGGVTHNPGARNVGWRAEAQQPGALVAQFATVYDDRAGFYFAAEDAAGHSKFIGATRAAEGLVVYSRRLGFDEGTVDQAYDLVSGGFEGTVADPCTWHDAADIYKAWAVKQKWCEKTFEQRDDVPAWMRDAPAMVRFGREWIEQPDLIRSWMKDYWKREFVPSPLVVAFWGWEKRGYWVTPDYFPVHGGNEAFASLVSDLHALGGHSFPWPSGYHWTRTYDKQADGSFAWDDRERFERIGHPHAVFNRDGRRYVRTPSWLRGGDCACMCGGDPWTRTWWNDYICTPLALLGCEMIQVDQVVGGHFPSCWSRAHPHGPGDGKWKTDVFLEQLVTMRETMRTNGVPDAVVCVEEPNEHYNHLVGIQDYRDCESGADEWASVFNYIYHEYLPCFQSNPRRGNRIWQAHEAADGQIPFLSPTRADLGGSHAALANGDFELATDEGKFLGWEKLNGYNGAVWNGRAYVDRETVHDGACSIRLESTKAETAVQVSQNVCMDDAAFSTGRTYRLSAWLKTKEGSAPNSVNMCFLGSSNKSTGGGGNLKFPAPEAGWQRVSREFTVPTGASYLRIMMHLNGNAVCWVDGMTLEEVLPDGSAREVENTGRGAYDDFMRRWVAFYHGEGRAWLAFGRQVKPPRVVCASLPYEVSLYGGRKVTGKRPAVFCNAYVAADGRKALVLVNATALPQPVDLYKGGQRVSLTLAGDEIRLLK